MKKYLIGFWRSLPVQLFLLHFRRYQILLVFWYILSATIAGSFMHTYGADSLFLAPEYLGKVGPLSTAIVGVAIGIFFMSWNITTFILHGTSVLFLATTAQPFIKFCINNAALPLLFLLYYLFSSYHYLRHQELLTVIDTVVLMFSFLAGVIFSVTIACMYFFGADKTIFRSLGDVIQSENTKYNKTIRKSRLPKEKTEMQVHWFLSAGLKLRKPRDIRHYPDGFLDSVFKRHHVASVIAIVVAFISLVLLGYTSDTRLFQIPAAVSITIFFAILIALSGAVAMFLGSWSIPVLVLMYMAIDFLYQQEWIDPRNKAYGLNYLNTNERPAYTRETIWHLASDSNIQADKTEFIAMLEKWKARQGGEKPVLVIINASGGGTRSATFTMNAMQRLDSLLDGKLMQQTVLINGASGGMLGAAYFRELYYRKLLGADINLQDHKYVEDISEDLLGSLFSSFVTRDIIGPVQKFEVNGYTYVKDRGYAFETKLNENTRGLLAHTIRYYKEPEEQALIPTMIFNSVINHDGRKMMVATRPVRFLMRPPGDTGNITPIDPDAVDFNSLFSRQDAMNVNVLSALRMNASFPYVLPNVWLPTQPVIDVMDGGLRDNFGQESSLRFITVFKDWLQQNTSRVILLQIRDRSLGEWSSPSDKNDFISTLTKPFVSLKNNLFNLQDYYQHDELEYISEAYGSDLYRICLQYVPTREEDAASLSFHLTAAEKRDIALALDNAANREELKKLKRMME